ncbi:MAG: hypothetical protein U1F46_14730 [Marinagarivorans sp.]
MNNKRDEAHRILADRLRQTPRANWRARILYNQARLINPSRILTRLIIHLWVYRSGQSLFNTIQAFIQRD